MRLLLIAATFSMQNISWKNSSNYRLLSPGSIAAIYGIVAVLWIFTSDHVVSLVAPELSTSHTIQTIKGTLFVLVTSLLLYQLILRYTHQLRDSEERYIQLFENLGDMVYLHDKEGKILKMNRAGREMLASCELQQIPETIQELFPSEHLALTNQQPIQLEFDGSITRETVLTNCKSKTIPVEIHVTRRVENNDIVFFQGVVRDITNRKAAEDKIKNLNAELEQRVVQRTAQLDSANKELQAFSYSVSHDLRAPLRAINGFASLLKESEGEKLTPNGQRFLNNILAATKEMGNLISDLLDYAKLGRTALKREPIPLAEMFASIQEKLSELISKTHAKIDIDIDLPTIESDRTQIEQIFSNLIVNALIYQKPGNTPEIRISCKQSPEAVQITVTDNGIGIDSNYFEKIFEVFQRLHSNAEYPGTGVGLAIVRKAARVLGGDVTVESAVDRGSSFTVTLRS